MSKLLVVVGATGGQGSSFVSAFLKSGSYKIRGLTHKIDSPASQKLVSQGVEIVYADLNDEDSLTNAFSGATAIFTVTDFFDPFAVSGLDAAMKIEYQQGINMTKAAIRTPTLEHYILSALLNSAKVSGGKHAVPNFAVKNKIDEFIQSKPELLAKTTFFSITFYASNLQYPVFAPIKVESVGKYIWLLLCSAETLFFAIGNHRINLGIFVEGILSRPDLTSNGKFVLGKVDILSAVDYVKLWGKVTGNEVEGQRPITAKDL